MSHEMYNNVFKQSTRRWNEVSIIVIICGTKSIMKRKFKQRWSTIPPLSTK